MRDSGPLTFYEFFCGGGMARAGLGAGWTCLFANDLDAKKAAAYRANWGGDGLHVGDVARVTPEFLPVRADLLWASFPCQDLSLAGAGAGLSGARSGAFWHIDRLIGALGAEGRAPAVVALENVVGLAASRGGADFAALAGALAGRGYRVGALALDARHFTPQSRPRLFIVALRADVTPPPSLVAGAPDPRTSTPGLERARERLSPAARAAWIDWRLPPPPRRNADLFTVLEDAPRDAPARPASECATWIAALSASSRRSLDNALRRGGRHVGAAFRRTRRDAAGRKVVRVEARFDGLAGCLRTPAGGSSRQSLFLVEDGATTLRALSAREAARLMGLPETYRLPEGATAAHHLLGDGVVAPVVGFLAEHLLAPLARAARR